MHIFYIAIHITIICSQPQAILSPISSLHAHCHTIVINFSSSFFSSFKTKVASSLYIASGKTFLLQFYFFHFFPFHVFFFVLFCLLITSNTIVVTSGGGSLALWVKHIIVGGGRGEGVGG
jgi:hypothetical protein